MKHQIKASFWQIWTWATMVFVLSVASTTIEQNENGQRPIPNDTEIYDSADHSFQKLMGFWEANVMEGGEKLTILLHLRSDGTSVYRFIYANEMGMYNGTWRHAEDILYEQFPDGTSGKGRIRWISNNKFELTIIDNGVPSYTGLKRYYQRKMVL